MTDAIMKLIKSGNHVTINGRETVLYWQNNADLVVDIPITDENKFWLCAGWCVVTQKRSKSIFNYFGNSLDEAITVFKELEGIE